MDGCLSYLLKSTICFSVLFIPFLLLLRRDRAFTVSRWLLLAIMLLSIILPAIDYRLPNEIEDSLPVHETMKYGVVVASMKGQISVTLTMIYAIGFCLALLWYARGLCVLFRVLRRDTIFDTYIDKGVALRYLTTEGSSFSWMNTIVLSQEDLEQNKEAILIHELAHNHLHHSYDKILMIILQTIQWFNPLVWLVNDVINELHEYEADARVVSSGINKRQYQMLLISKITSPAKLAFANGLNMSNVKNRIAMINKQSHRFLSAVRQSLLIPATLTVVTLLATYTTKDKFHEVLRQVTISFPQTTTEETPIPTSRQLRVKNQIPNSNEQTSTQEMPEVTETESMEEDELPTQEELFVTMVHESQNASHNISRRNETDVIKSVIAEYINNKKQE